MDIEIMMYINGGNGGGNNGGSTPLSAPVRRIRESNTRKDMKQNKTTITEAELKNIIAESIKKVLKETELDYDMDNFSGRWSRGPRYNIYIGDTLMYRDVPEETADRVWDEVCRKAEMWGEEPRCEEI